MSMRDRVVTIARESARSSSRPRAVACAVVFALLTACGNAPQDPVTISTDEIALQGSQTPELRRQLAAGMWLVEVRERNMDLRATISSPGLDAVELEDATPRHGALHQVVSLAGPGELRVMLRSDDNPATRGHAIVRIARFARAAGEPPGAVELGYRAWAQANAEHARGTPEAWARAADELNEAILQFETGRETSARGGAAYALANLQYLERDDVAAAIRASEIASESFSDAEDEAGVQNAAIVRAAAEIDLASGLDAGTRRAEQKSLYETADRRLDNAAKFFIESGLPARAASATNFRGVRAANLGDDKLAATHFSRALELARTGEDQAEQVKALINLAWTHRLQGQVRQAADEYASLMPLLDAERQPYYYGVVLNNYGFCLIALGEFDRALELHTEALDVFTRLDQKDERAMQLTALGALYFRVGDAHRALETLRAAIQEQEKISDTRALVSTLRVAGNAASTIGQHDLALEYLRRSASLDANPHHTSRTRVLIASELRQVGDLRGADNELAQALTSSNKVVHADSLAERARLRLAQRRPSDALADLRAADAAYRDLGLEFSRIETNSMLAQSLLEERDVAAAGRAADEALAIVSRLRVNSANPEWRARFLSAQYAPFEARIAVDLATAPDAGIDPAWKAFRTADEVRARSLADQLAHAGKAFRPDGGDVDHLRDMLTAQQLRLEARVQSSQTNDDTIGELRREIAETRARLDEHRVRETPVLAGTSQLPASLREVQKKLPEDTLVLAYFVGDSASHGWMLSRETLRHTTLPGRSQLQKLIEAVAEHPASPGGVRQSRTLLGNLLVGKLLDGMRERKLLIIPDGPLNGVPYAALPAMPGSETMLVDRFLIGYAPSLALAFAQPAPARDRASRVAVISDPVYAADDKRLASLNAGARLRNAREQSANKLTRLPYSALEARAVQETFGPKDTVSISGFDATRARVLELASQELSVLHFATHALAREDAPERSALFLSEYARDGSFHADSQLSTSDIMSSGLRARVVVLSGCATGDGSTLRGEGVLGLTYGFLANGTGAVVASLWPVEDASTARLMSEFYRAYRTHGNASEALRTAQLRARASHPDAAVWSSFVVRANGFP